MALRAMRRVGVLAILVTGGVHLQHQVRSTLQVEPKVNVVGQSGKKGIRTNALRNPEDPKQEEQHRADDE